MLPAGKLRSLVTAKRPDTTQDEAGQPMAVWVDVGKPFWANIRHISGMETIRADAESSAVKASIRARFRTDLDASMRIVHGSTIYKINAVLPDEERREHIDLACEVVQ